MSGAISISPLSVSSVFIEMLFEQQQLAIGTAFFYRAAGQLYLVSNWHNFSGRDPTTQKTLRRDGAIPDRVRVYARNTNEPRFPEVVTYLLAEDHIPKWYEHPVFGSRVDVGALCVGQDSKDGTLDIQAAIQCIDPHEKWPIEAGEQLYIIGFPFGLSSGAFLPVWKSASIATEPRLDVNNLPLFYVDTASRPGMSGSPVVQHTRRAIALTTSKGSRVDRFRAEFVGVYSGRIVAKDSLDAQLGLVWKARTVDEIIAGRRLVEV